MKRKLDKNFDHYLVHTGQNFDKELSKIDSSMAVAENQQLLLRKAHAEAVMRGKQGRHCRFSEKLNAFVLGKS